MNAFIKASKEQLRFQTSKGFLSVEDLWTLKLVDLDRLAVSIHASLADASVSFLENPNTKESKETELQKLRLEVVKIVIESKQTENRALLAKGKSEAQKEFLKDLLNKKKLEEMDSLSVEEIEKRLAEV